MTDGAKQSGLDQLIGGVVDEEEEDNKPWYVNNYEGGPPWKGEINKEADEKPCRFCGCISPKNEDHALAGEFELWTCPNCNMSFRPSWNEYAPYRDFLKGVEIDGWRKYG